MTRPMPGPPECECPEVPEHLWTTYAGAVDPNTLFEYTPECPLHVEVSSPKRLKDAECETEMWRAAYEFVLAQRERLLPAVVRNRAIRADTLARFATRPHALEEM